MTISRSETRGGHSYRDDGVKVDGVTTLLNDGFPKPALINWAANTTASYAIDHWDELAMQPISDRMGKLKSARFAQRDAAARRGTEVHALAEQLIYGHEVEIPDAIAGHVESYVRFLDTWKPTPVLVESVVANRRWQYAGTLDMVVDLPDGRRVIADIKTTRSGIYPETAYQLAAYAHAEVYLGDDGTEHPMPDLDIHGGLGIWVRGDGFDVYPVDITEQTHRAFLHIAYVARQTKTNKALVGEALDAPEVSP